ncbi:MAG TPA: alpha/beta hydrolase [Candidatus Limnocylindrales bacterium]
MTAASPSLVVASPDGTPIAVFTSGIGPPLVLVHGATADHTTFRVVGPILAHDFTVHAIDRRGRGASGDAPPYSIEREYEDLAAVAEAVVAAEGSVASVAVFGHSYGGRCALGAALLTDTIARVVSYEGAPTPPGSSYHPTGIEARLRERLAAGDRDGALARFLTEVVGMRAEDLAAFQADPVWPLRAAAAGTILRELEAEADPAASLDRLGAVRQPVLQLLGGESLPVFREATVALDGRLADGRIIVIEGARHAAHHTHPDEVVAAVRGFLA